MRNIKLTYLLSKYFLSFVQCATVSQYYLSFFVSVVFLSWQNFISTRLLCNNYLQNLILTVVVVVPRLWKLCDGMTFVNLELHFWGILGFTSIILLWIRNFEKNWTTPTPPKTSSFEQRCVQRKGLRLNCRDLSDLFDLVRIVMLSGLDLSDLPISAI